MLSHRTDWDRLKKLPLLQGVSEETFCSLTAGASLRNFRSGATLLIEGDPVDCLYVLLDGVVELWGTWSDRDTTLAVLRPVSTFILAAVVLDAPALMSAQTVESSEILLLPGQSFRRAMIDDPQFGFAVAQELAGCYRGIVRTIKGLKLRGSVERLANYLITQMVRQGDKSVVMLPHGKQVLASLLGMAPENLSRAFAALADYGVVVERRRVVISQPALLRSLAKPTPYIDNHSRECAEAVGKAKHERWPAAQVGLL